MQTLYNTETQMFHPYPRADGDEIIGLDSVYQIYTLKIEPQPNYDAATQFLQSAEVINHEANTVTRFWQIEQIVPMPATKLQARVWLIRNGIDPANIPAIIEASFPPGAERLEALERWNSAATIPFNHPLVAVIAASLNLDPAAIWAEVLAIE
jgi:hypothetical protein